MGLNALQKMKKKFQFFIGRILGLKPLCDSQNQKVLTTI
jgi:hypothetical protein